MTYLPQYYPIQYVSTKFIRHAKRWGKKKPSEEIKQVSEPDTNLKKKKGDGIISYEILSNND